MLNPSYNNYNDNWTIIKRFIIKVIQIENTAWDQKTSVENIASSTEGVRRRVQVWNRTEMQSCKPETTGGPCTDGSNTSAITPFFLLLLLSYRHLPFCSLYFFKFDVFCNTLQNQKLPSNNFATYGILMIKLSSLIFVITFICDARNSHSWHSWPLKVKYNPAQLRNALL